MNEAEIDFPKLQRGDGVHMLRSNDDVIALLETYLEAAHKHPFGAIAISMVGYPNIAGIDWAGEIRLEKMLGEAVDKMQTRIKDSVEGWEFPEQDPELDMSYARYNIACGPIGFDFLTWLVRQEMLRIKAGAPAPLKVAFWFGKNDDYAAKIMQTRNRHAWLNNVFRPCMKFIGAVEVERAIYGHSEPIFVPRMIIEDARKGYIVPMLQPPSEGGCPGVTTITLREKADGDVWRNSNVDGWIRFAEFLQKRGEDVIVIRDTEQADNPILGTHTHPLASRDLSVRMAVYGAAKMNFFVENGPASLCEYSKIPYVKFWNVDGSERLRHEDFVQASFGMKVGEQFPWAGDNQRISWVPDTYDNIKSAWEEMVFLSGLGQGHDRAA